MWSNRVAIGRGADGGARDEPVDLDPPDVVEPRDEPPEPRAAQPVTHRGQRQSPRRTEASGGGDDRPTRSRPASEFSDQPALADTGLAGDDQHSGMAGNGVTPACEHLVELRLAADKPSQPG